MKKYKSIYGSRITEFIGMKRALGFKYESAVFILSAIDAFAYQRRESTEGITRDFADAWKEKRLNESDQYRYARVSILAQLSSFLNELNISSYIPKLPPYPTNNFIPHIYSPEEIQSLFAECDNLRIKQMAIKSSLFCMPALIRLLYATGIRISEALNLKNEDIDIEKNMLKIKDSKNGKERTVPFSDSLSSVFKEYLQYKNKIPGNRERSGHLFENLKGEKIRYQPASVWFKKCLEKAGINHIGRKQGPRLHDLRHTFACHALVNMVENGMDLYVSLPVLSTYLGHQSLESTNMYVRLTANMYPEIIKDTDLICLDVFPKVNFYEAD